MCTMPILNNSFPLISVVFSNHLFPPPSLPLSLSFSPGRPYVWLSQTRCAAVRPGRWTCTAPQSAPCRTAAHAPSEYTSGCQCHTPHLHTCFNMWHIKTSTCYLVCSSLILLFHKRIKTTTKSVYFCLFVFLTMYANKMRMWMGVCVGVGTICTVSFCILHILIP